MEHLFDKLKENGESNIYPLHMPGHKRHECGKLPEEMYLRDITEIDGFDNLHQPEEILLELQCRAAELYGAEESFYLINGSTAGILSAISAALPAGGHILMSRNCHKSAYHGAYLRNLTISYLYPKVMGEYDIFDAILPEQVQEALELEPDVGAVLIVSPTYEGRISDIGRIAEIVHKKNIPLIVDEAHGAHLGWEAGFAENSCRLGADLVIHSVHKTLPALTQTALFHVNGNLIDREQLRRFLHIYQTSSPSYLLMASIDNALDYVSRETKHLFGDFLENWNKMLSQLSVCKHLHFLTRGSGTAEEKSAGQDVGKLVISTRGTNISGRQLYDILLKEYQMQPEMASESYVLAMFTVNDTKEGYERLAKALLEIDGRLTDSAITDSAVTDSAVTDSTVKDSAVADDVVEKIPRVMQDKRAIPLAKAWDMEKTVVDLDEAVGCYAGEFVNLYPPGVPVLVPGERISRKIYESICRWICQGLTVQGVEVRERKISIRILQKVQEE